MTHFARGVQVKRLALLALVMSLLLTVLPAREAHAFTIERNIVKTTSFSPSWNPDQVCYVTAQLQRLSDNRVRTRGYISCRYPEGVLSVDNYNTPSMSWLGKSNTCGTPATACYTAWTYRNNPSGSQMFSSMTVGYAWGAYKSASTSGYWW